MSVRMHISRRGYAEPCRLVTAIGLWKDIEVWGLSSSETPSADVSNYVVGSAQLRGEASHRPDTCRIIDAAGMQSPHNQGQNKTLAGGRWQMAENETTMESKPGIDLGSKTGFLR